MFTTYDDDPQPKKDDSSKKSKLELAIDFVFTIIEIIPLLFLFSFIGLLVYIFLF